METLNNQGRIEDRYLEEEMRDSYISYAMSVIVGRALPDIRDGLKPVHRRILYTMQELNLRHNHPFKKNARIVGECFAKDTLVSTAKGLSPIQDIKEGNFVITQKGLRRVTKLYYMPPKRLLEVILENGLSNTVTPSQKFKVFTQDLEFIFKEAKHLKKGDYVVLKATYPQGLNYVNVQGIILNENIGYLLGLLMSDGWVEADKRGYHRLGFCSQDREVLEKINIILKKEFGFEEAILKKESIYYLRINKSLFNKPFIKNFSLDNLSAINKFIPQEIFASPPSVIYAFVAGLIEGDGSIHKKRQCLNYSSVSEKLISQLQVLLLNMGILSVKYKNPSRPHKLNNKWINSNFPCYSLEVSSRSFKKLIDSLELFSYKKEIARKKDCSRLLPSKYEIIPFLGRQLFWEFKYKHLGGGWYCDEEKGEKFRLGIKYRNGTKIRYSGDLLDKIEVYTTTVKDLSILDKAEKINSKYAALLRESLEENLYFVPVKQIRQAGFEQTYDIEVEKDHEFIANGMISHNCLGKYHPHGDMAVYDALVRMAQDFSLRYPLIEGQGNFGSLDGDPPAAMRYCITGESLVSTDKGLIPIKNIAQGQEVDIDLGVLNHRGEKVKAVKFFNSHKHPTIKLSTSLGYQVQGSYNHPVLCWSKNKQNKPCVKWKLLEEITGQDYLIINRKFSLLNGNRLTLTKYYPNNQQYKDIALPKYMDEELAFLLGALVSEASFHQGRILFSNSDPGFYNKVREIILRKFKGTKLYERQIKGNCRQLSFYHQKGVEFLQNIGFTQNKSCAREIPLTILRANRASIAAFLRGLFEGDGSVTFKTDKRHQGKSIELTYNSKSKKLIQQLKVLLLQFGIVTARPYKDKRNSCYKLIISGQDNIMKFYQEINFFSQRKKQALANIKVINPQRMSKTDNIPFLCQYLRSKYRKEFVRKNNFDRYNRLKGNYHKLISLLDKEDTSLIDWLLKNEFFFDQVKRLKKCKPDFVYSLKVDSLCHSFVANGFVNHNTEARLSRISDYVLQDIEKRTVDFAPNFDNSLKEPLILPTVLPNLLVNGSSGIAVGMATNIPPHNLGEVVKAITYLLDNPSCSIKELNKIIKGPDFPTGGIICGRREILRALEEGRGRLTLRAKATIEQTKSKTSIVITELPYQVNKANLLEAIANLVNAKKIEGITDLRDESDKDGLRIVLELRKDTEPRIILNQLYKHTTLETTFGVIFLALVNNRPQILNIKQALQHHISHRKEVIIRRSKFELEKAQARAHILEGLKIALKFLDKVIETIKKSKSPKEAREQLVKKFKLTEIQAQAILEMQLQRLTALERDKINKEYLELIKKIEYLKSILSSEKKQEELIKKELKELGEKFDDTRRTEITAEKEEIEIEDLIVEEDVVITISHNGYIKRQPLTAYRRQARGGRGITAMATREEDFVEHLFVSSSKDTLLFFSSTGKVYGLKAYEVPEGTRTSKGRAIVNVLSLSSKEQVTAVIAIKEFKDNCFLLMATQKGLVKRCTLNLFSHLRKSGIIAISLAKDDSLIGASLVEETSGEILLATEKGKAIRCKISQVRPTGRTSQGVKGISLAKDDKVLGMVLITSAMKKQQFCLFTVTKKGFAKRTELKAYRLQSRAGKGIIGTKISSKTGKVSATILVSPDDEVMAITQKGILIRCKVETIRPSGRATQGVRFIRLEKNDLVSSLTRIVEKE